MSCGTKSLPTPMFTNHQSSSAPREGNVIGNAKNLYPWYDIMTSSMETFSVLMALCDGIPSVTGGFRSQRASYVDLWCFFVVSLNKHSIGRWFETPWRSFGVTVMSLKIIELTLQPHLQEATDSNWIQIAVHFGSPDIQSMGWLLVPWQQKQQQPP